MKTSLVFVVALAGVLTASAAFAHARLEKAVPGVGSTVAGASELRLEFNEGVEPKFTSVVVTKQGGGAVAAGKPAVEGDDNKNLVVKFSAPLVAGVYDVEWKAVSVDTHHTQGNFTFTVKP